MRPGDVINPHGGIYIGPNYMLQTGVVIIHRSRLRRAKRFGWTETEADKPVDAGLIAVRRVLDDVPANVP